MAESKAVPVSSIKSRIAALNLEEVHTPAPGTKPAYRFEPIVPTKAARPPPPPPPSQPVSLSKVTRPSKPLIGASDASISKISPTHPDAQKSAVANVHPALPPRPPTRPSQRPPSLPPRTSSEHRLERRESAESISTVASGISTLSASSTRTNTTGAGPLYQIRAPAYDPSVLPPLPPKRSMTEEPKPTQSRPTIKSRPTAVTSRSVPPSLPARPPLPERQASALPVVQKSEAALKRSPTKSALLFGLSQSSADPPPLPKSRSNKTLEEADSSPPPIPLASRPNLAAIQALKPTPSSPSICLWCRDFSVADGHAAKFSRQAIPHQDIAWLASQLTAPFPSLTDKARVLFTWLHLNIDYNVHDFFNGTVKHCTAEDTLRTGLAVCAGYAGLFNALADNAGLQSVVINGHGKGFSHSPLKSGEPIPAFSSNHAWNAVRIDNGEWKLIDCCWGAGHVQGRGMPYVRKFAPECFSMDNNEFGERHFPEKQTRFYRTDGRTSISWEEYVLNDVPERLQVYGPCTSEYGIGKRTFQPSQKHIPIRAGADNALMRFQFASVCPHWDNEKHGKGQPCVMILCIGGKDGREKDYLAFETDGRVWWLDVSREALGSPGQEVTVCAVNTFDGRNGRGVSVAEFRKKKGRVAMSFDGVAMWKLV